MNNSTFFKALQNEDAYLVNTLLGAGFNPDTTNSKGQYPLHLMVKKENAYIISILLKAQANPNVIDETNRTPLQYAIKSENAYLVKTLLDAHANTDVVDEEGNTLLHICVKRENNYLMSLLLNAGANTNLTNSKGETPLFIAVKKENAYMVRLLLGAGADTQIANTQHVFPLDIAVKNENRYICSLLTQKTSPILKTSNSSGVVIKNREENGFFSRFLDSIKAFIFYFQKKEKVKKEEVAKKEQFLIGTLDLTELYDISKKNIQASNIEQTKALQALQEALGNFLKIAKKNEQHLEQELIENFVFLKNNFPNVIQMTHKISHLSQDIKADNLSAQNQELNQLYQKFALYIEESRNTLNKKLIASLNKDLAIEHQMVDNKNNKHLKANY